MIYLKYNDILSTAKHVHANIENPIHDLNFSRSSTFSGSGP